MDGRVVRSPASIYNYLSFNVRDNYNVSERIWYLNSRVNSKCLVPNNKNHNGFLSVNWALCKAPHRCHHLLPLKLLQEAGNISLTSWMKKLHMEKMKKGSLHEHFVTTRFFFLHRNVYINERWGGKAERMVSGGILQREWGRQEETPQMSVNVRTVSAVKFI